MGASGTNGKTIMVWRVASQVQGNADLLGKAFQSGKMHGVMGTVISDIFGSGSISSQSK